MNNTRTTTIISLLAAASRLGEPPLGRTAIVKLSYLAEILRPSYQLWSRAFDFVRYHYGPYADDILQKVDFLVFHGLVRVSSYNEAPQGPHVTYVITSEGLDTVIKLQQVNQAKIIYSLSEDIVWSLQSIGIKTTATDLCRLVYNEPAFADISLHAERDDISTSAKIPLPIVHDSDHPSFRIQAVLSGLQSDRREDIDSPRDLVLRFINYLVFQIYKMEKTAKLDKNE